MFNNLSERLSGALKSIGGKNKITEANISDSLREVRMALLEADVALPVVMAFIDQVKARALGTEVATSLSAGQTFIKIVNEELTKLMGEANESLNLATQPPAVILMAGLQGAGKTTSTAKLAKHLIEKEKKKVLLVSADVYRPAAIDQLETLAGQVGAEFFPSQVKQKPVKIAQAAIKHARKTAADVVIVDTAGRLAIDAEMMAEIKAVHKAANPVETLFVVDSMTGQDAANTAKAFHDALPLTGVILTKADGDARGGAALSIRFITGEPIKFIGTGEKAEALEPFHPDRLASRILGMGDVLSLIEEVEQKVDQQKAEKLARKISKGKGFTLVDMKEQLEQVAGMGDLAGMLGKLPGMGQMAGQINNANMNKDMRRQIAIINSMTPKERRNPLIISGSRKRRIANGSGLQIADVNRLLKQHKQMEKMMKKMGKGGMAKMMRGMGGMGGGGMPPGMPPGGGLPPGMGGGMPPMGGGGNFPFK
jgi:signal recognition particle subunit SRP54